LAVKIYGNRGAPKEISVSTKVSKEVVPFQQEFPIKECDVKNDPTPIPSVVGNPTPPKNLRFRNPGVKTNYTAGEVFERFCNYLCPVASLVHYLHSESFSSVLLSQGCATGGSRATTRPAKPFSVALANNLIFPHHA